MVPISRRQAREWAVQMLFAADQNPPADVDAFVADGWSQLRGLDKADGATEVMPARLRRFAEERVRGVLGSLAEIDETLSGLLDNWALDRLGAVERVVLRLGVWEMKNTDVPKAVIINEAIDLANWFSSPKSRTLVNGVLDKYGKMLAKESGRVENEERVG